MGFVSVEAIELGMVLADDVVDRQGRMLLSNGTQLTAKQIQVLKTWGIVTVNIKADQDDETANRLADYPAAWQEEAQALAEAHFCTTQSSLPFIQRLQEIWIERYLAMKG